VRIKTTKITFTVLIIISCANSKTHLLTAIKWQVLTIHYCNSRYKKQLQTRLI